MLLDGDCAPPAGLNALDGSRVPGWFDVPPASSQQCTVTLIELPFREEGKAGRPAVKGNQFANR